MCMVAETKVLHQFEQAIHQIAESLLIAPAQAGEPWKAQPVHKVNFPQQNSESKRSTISVSIKDILI